MGLKRHGQNRDVSSADIARRAVERLAEGQDLSIEDAVDDARRELRSTEHARRPTRSELRAHAQAYEESLGPDVRPQRLRATFGEMLDLLATLEALVLREDPDGIERPAPQVYGRAALGEFDLDPVVHIRLTTTLTSASIARTLVEFGLEEPAFTTIESRVGRLDQIDTSSARSEYRVLRIPPSVLIDPDLDLLRGKRIPHAGFEELSRRFSRFETL
jgi:hypothetical protein